MILITCPDCQSRHLVGTRSMRRMVNSDAGPIALVTCPYGHEVVVRFRDRTVRSAGAAAEEAFQAGLGHLEVVGEQVRGRLGHGGEQLAC